MAAREIDPRVQAGLERQLQGWRNLLAGGAERLGWKLGLNQQDVRRKLGLHDSVIGFLTTASQARDGDSLSVGGLSYPLVEPEVAVELRRDVEPGAQVDEALAAIESLGPALELVDVAPPPEDVEEILAGNVYHRAVAFGAPRQDAAVSGAQAVISVDGEERGRAAADVDLAATIRLVADLLGSCGERLCAGDRIITGSLTRPVKVSAGQRVDLDLGALGTLGLSFEA